MGFGEFGRYEMIGCGDKFLDEGVVKFIQIEIIPMDLIHMVGGTDTVILDAQFCAQFGWQFNCDARFGCVELHQ